ncbi:MAG: DUF342 domain-containing protein [Spirochaetaceae bacterium]|nr:MAG: DUF342 domain-containing protein [Spirochaetaceae bacterium]
MGKATQSLKGVLKITIDDSALKVTLTFEATADGDEWTEDRIVEALRERGVKTDILGENIAAFLRSASAGGSGIHSDVVLKGIAPVPPAPDTPVWEELSVPERLHTVADRVTADADPPTIFRTVKETVEREKKVTRKEGRLFRKDRTEVQVVRETVDRQEKVFVDSTVLKVTYCDAGALLARLTPRSAGLPGRDVFGRTLPIRALPDPAFHAGSNVEQKGDEIRAAATGFVRIGRNWVDVIPFTPHQWSVELSNDRATCYLVITPGHRLCTPPVAADVLSAVDDLSYSRDSLMSESEIETLIREQIAKGEPARLPVSSSRDASFDIIVAEDRLEAYLNIHKGKGRGKPLSLREIGTAIKESGLRKLDFEKIKTDINAFYESGEMDLTSYPLCAGTAPVPGPERQVEYSLSFDPEARTEALKEGLRRILESDSTAGDETVHMPSLAEFPPAEIQKTAAVKAEQLICTIDPPTPGEPGQDVYGMIINAEAAAAPKIRLFENVTQRDQVIVTTAAGVLDFRESEGTTFIRVRPHRDATVKVSLDDTRMQALLTLEEGVGSGTRLERDSVDRALAEAKVVQGIEEESIERALAAARAGTPVKDFVVARGLEPVDQSENRIEFLLATDAGSPVRIRKDGSADFRTRGSIITVRTGQEICRILPSSQEAVDGVDVLGNTVPARKLGGIPLEVGENLAKETLEDGTVLVKAEIEGELQYSDKTINLLATHTVKGDVDMSVGNIKFPGSVIIGGTVRTGFYVISTGDVTIAGGVEGALISSDGHIYIKEGVKGAGKAVLRSKQNIVSPFVELATVLAVGDLLLKSALVRSRIKCNGKIAFKGDKGRIVGGTIRARNGFEVSSVGSTRGVKTQLSFGQDYLVADLIEKEEKEIDKVKRRITQVDLEMRKSEKERDTAALDSLRKEKVTLLKLMEKRGLRLFTLRERFEQHFPSRIVVRNEVHVGTIFESHGRTVEITRSRKAIAVEFNPHTGNIDVNDLNGE